jgi:hypothetical protein
MVIIRAGNLILVNEVKSHVKGTQRVTTRLLVLFRIISLVGFRARVVAIRMSNLSVTFSLLVVPPRPQPALPCSNIGSLVETRSRVRRPGVSEPVFCRVAEMGAGSDLVGLAKPAGELLV